MFCWHVFGNICGGFRGISPFLGNFAGFRGSMTARNIRSPDYITNIFCQFLGPLLYWGPLYTHAQISGCQGPVRVKFQQQVYLALEQWHKTPEMVTNNPKMSWKVQQWQRQVQIQLSLSTMATLGTEGFFLSKAPSRILFSILFRVSNHQN